MLRLKQQVGLAIAAPRIGGHLAVTIVELDHRPSDAHGQCLSGVSNRSLVAFPGQVDAAFTVWSHQAEKPIFLGVFFQGSEGCLLFRK